MAALDQTETWVRAAQAGDRASLARLLTTYHGQLRGRAEARMPSALKARCGPDDILQEVYFDVVRQIERFEDRGEGSFLRWVHSILDHKVAEAWRAAHRHVRDVDREVPAEVAGASSSYIDLLDHVYRETGTPSQVARRDEAIDALMPCLMTLTESHQLMIRLRFLEGRPVSEVAERLGKSEGAVVAMTKRALVALREAMDRLGEFTRG